jgi:uncharacterized protein YhbP (UPF0306 family)
MKKEIANFIKDNKIATIACVDGLNRPYCFNCFYVYDDRNHLLFFKSSLNTQHAKFLSNNPAISGTILPDKIDFMALKGIQFTGKIVANRYPNSINPEVYYHKKMPFALSKPGHVWFVELETIKMTDNTLLFGKKLSWERSMPIESQPS